MPKSPVVSGRDVLKVLSSLGYSVLRQRGSHVHLGKITQPGEHHITIPLHEEIARGTLNDIVSSVAQWNNIPKETVYDMLRK